MATDHTLQATVMWFQSRPGESYRVQVATNTTFTSTILDRSGITGSTGWTVFALSKNTTYYWRVNASRNGKTSNWSPTWSFTTTNAVIPAAPSLISPANAVTLSAEEVIFTWSAVAGATGYDIFVGGEPTFSGGEHIQWYGYTGTSYQPGFEALIESCLFQQYWRVRARNPAGAGAWSEVRAFTLNSLLPASISSSSGRRSAGNQYRAQGQQNALEIPVGSSLLGQNYPNPFSHTTLIGFTVPQDGHTTLRAYDAMGREVEKLFDATAQAGVRQEAVFNGDRHPDGVYFYRLTMPGNVTVTKSMVLRK
jgi:hypothetical protein